jgi:lipid A 4'-phosphatase
MGKTKKILLDFSIPLIILLSLTLILSATSADLILAGRFYLPSLVWPGNTVHPWIDLYQYGNVPPLILSLFGLAVFVASFPFRKMAPYRKIGLFLVVYMVLGPGLIINTVFKDHWGRPRPAEVQNFGGHEKYLPVWERGIAGKGKSFPSGHAAIGYFLFSPFFFLRNPSRGWAWFFLLLGLAYGTLMGIGRMAQGGHFATDVLWAGGLTYMTGLLLAYFFRFDKMKIT